MKLVIQSGVCDAVTGFWGIWDFDFFAGTFPLFWLQRSVRGFSYCLFPIAYSLIPIPLGVSSINQNLRG